MTTPTDLTHIDDIRAAVFQALDEGEGLTVEYDSGRITYTPGELRQAWEDMTLDDPFTIPATERI